MSLERKRARNTSILRRHVACVPRHGLPCQDARDATDRWTPGRIASVFGSPLVEGHATPPSRRAGWLDPRAKRRISDPTPGRGDHVAHRLRGRRGTAGRGGMPSGQARLSERTRVFSVTCWCEWIGRSTTTFPRPPCRTSRRRRSRNWRSSTARRKRAEKCNRHAPWCHPPRSNQKWNRCFEPDQERWEYHVQTADSENRRRKMHGLRSLRSLLCRRGLGDRRRQGPSGERDLLRRPGRMPRWMPRRRDHYRGARGGRLRRRSHRPAHGQRPTRPPASPTCPTYGRLPGGHASRARRRGPGRRDGFRDGLGPIATGPMAGADYAAASDGPDLERRRRPDLRRLRTLRHARLPRAPPGREDGRRRLSEIG